MVRKGYILLAMGLLCLAMTGTALAEQVEEKSFPLTQDGFVSVKNVAGMIEIHGWDQGQVKMMATRKGPEADKITIEIDAQEDCLKIDTHWPTFIWRSWVNYELWVPSGATIRAESVSGDIRIKGQHNYVRAHTTSGDIELIGIWGEIDVDTTSGDIYTERSKEDIIVHSVSGDVKILEARGAVQIIRTTSGRIWVELEEIDDAVSEMSFKSVSGTINLFLPPDTAANIHMSTTSGEISSDFPITIEETVSKLELRGTIAGGGTLIKLKTTSGDISLRKL